MNSPPTSQPLPPKNQKGYKHRQTQKKGGIFHPGGLIWSKMLKKNMFLRKKRKDLPTMKQILYDMGPLTLVRWSLLRAMCVFIPSPVRVGTLLMEVPGTPIGASFFVFELKPNGKDSSDTTQHECQHHILLG